MNSAFRFHIATFGCKISQYESQAIREHWQSLGGLETADPAGADVLLAATCAVTAEAVSDARQTARKWRATMPGARIIVSGCAATAAPGDFPGADAIIAQKDKACLLACHPLESQETSATVLSDAAGITEDAWPPFIIHGFQRARPVLKVQDGCSHRCTYCIVPLTRGPARSRRPDDVVAEARRLLEAGHREIMISGINLRQYRFAGMNFWALLRQLNDALAPEWQGRARLRLSSLEPAQLDAEGLESLEACSLLCPHVHLSLQSGSPSVLRRMGRAHYRPEDMLEAISRLRTFWPVFGLGADILMGFPGETKEELAETLAMVSALPLTYAHVFPWSSRPGTKAASLPDSLPKAQRQEHAALIRRVIEKKHEAFLREQAALPAFRLALDGQGARHGTNEFYAPCELIGESPATGHELLAVRPLRVEGGRVLASTMDMA